MKPLMYIVRVLVLCTFTFLSGYIFGQNYDWEKDAKPSKKNAILKDLEFKERDQEKMRISISNLPQASIKQIILRDIRVTPKDQVKPPPKVEFSERQIGTLTNVFTFVNDTLTIKLNILFEKFNLENVNKSDYSATMNLIVESEKALALRIPLIFLANNSGAETGTEVNAKLPDFPDFPAVGNQPKNLKPNKKNRYLLIDANPHILFRQNNDLLKRKKSASDDAVGIDNNFRRAVALNERGSLSLIIRNYNFDLDENFVVSLQTSDYIYQNDISNLYTSSEKDSEPDAAKSNGYLESADIAPTDSILLENHLAKHFNLIEKIIYLNLNDLNKLNAYKTKLQEYYTNKKDQFTPAAKSTYDKIMSWSVEYVALTPISLSVKNSDEVKIMLTRKSDDKVLEQLEVGNYRMTGGMAVNVGTQFYVTGLKSNEVYTIDEEIRVNDTTTVTELRAKMDTENQLSVGLGFNAEVYFRTGRAFKPAWNIGFFVPLGTELTPILATGPGLSIGNENVKLSINGGLAFGQVNDITEKYKDVDLNGIEGLTNESLTQKVWKQNWFVGIGVSYNLKNN